MRAGVFERAKRWDERPERGKGSPREGAVELVGMMVGAARPHARSGGMSDTCAGRCPAHVSGRTARRTGCGQAYSNSRSGGGSDPSVGRDPHARQRSSGKAGPMGPGASEDAKRRGFGLCCEVRLPGASSQRDSPSRELHH